MIETTSEKELAGQEPQRSQAGAVIEGAEEVWVVAAPPGGELTDFYLEEEVCDVGPPLRICRAVLDGGVLLIGDAEPGQDDQVLELLQSEHCAQA